MALQQGLRRARHRDVDARHSHQPAKPQPRSGREAVHDVGQTAVIVHDQRHASHPHEAGHHQISPDAERRNAAVDVNDLWAAEDEAACHTDDETDRVQDLDNEPAAVDGPKPADPLEQKAAARFRSTDSEDLCPGRDPAAGRRKVRDHEDPTRRHTRRLRRALWKRAGKTTGMFRFPFRAARRTFVYSAYRRVLFICPGETPGSFIPSTR